MGAGKDLLAEVEARYNTSGPAGVASLYASDPVCTDPNVVCEGREASEDSSDLASGSDRPIPLRSQRIRRLNDARRRRSRA
jgi:hypothetical protein